VAQLFSLGDIVLMKIYRIVGVGWIALCIFIGFFVFGQIRYVYWLENDTISFPFFLFIGALLLLIGGIVAGAVLHHGATWARILICSIAILSGIMCGMRAMSVWSEKGEKLFYGVIAIYSLLSAIILLLPKKYVA
jgi:uncharacterized membrane protein HdeD (DUF308 family)